MSTLTDTASCVAKRLLSENREHHRSWSTIAKEDFGGKISRGTLSWFANGEGKRIPRSQRLRRILGLTVKRDIPEWIKRWRRLPKEKRDALIRGAIESERIVK